MKTYMLPILLMMAGLSSLGCENDITLPVTGTIYGDLMYADGEHAAGISVKVEGTDQIAVSDSEGRFVINGVLAVDEAQMGRYYVVRGAGERSGVPVGFLVDHFKVKGQQSYSIGIIVVRETGSISGRMFLQGMTDHSGISVTIKGTSMRAITRADGSFVLDRVPAHEGYELLCQHDGFMTETIATFWDDGVQVPLRADPLSNTQLADTWLSSDYNDDAYWSPDLNLEGVAGFIDAIEFSGDQMYVGGHFRTIGGRNVHHLARWDGNTWHSVGGGVATREMGIIHRILVDLDKIYIGGCFLMVGGSVPSCNISVWNGSTWNMMMGGTDRAVRAIALAPNGDLYVGGEFTMAGGMPARGIARWDGMSWHTLGAGVDNHVSAIAIRGNDVYVGGAFRTAGGQQSPFIAHWDGENWHPLASGVNMLVTALALDGNTLYVGGMFDSAGGVRVNRIARWRGGTWSALGSGLSGSASSAVRAIYVDGDNVFVGGFFRGAGSHVANNVAVWNGSSWNPLGSGTDNVVTVLNRRHSGMLLVGGRFASAGGKSSVHMAGWTRSSLAPTAFPSL